MVLRQKGKLVQGELVYYFKDSLVKASLKESFDEKNANYLLNHFPQFITNLLRQKIVLIVFCLGILF